MKKELDYIRQFHTISYDNLDEVKEYLERMASSGWMLESIEGSCRFVFKKIEPKELRFAVEIFVDGSILDTKVISSNQEFIEYCKRAGWDFVCNTGKVNVFVTENSDAAEIESDPKVKLQTIRKACRPYKVLVPIMFLLMGAGYFSLYLTINLNLTECSFFASSALLLWVFVAAIYVWQLVSYFLWLGKAKAAAQAGERLPGHRVLRFFTIWGLIGIFALIHSAFSVAAGILFDEKVMFVIPAIWGVMLLVVFVSYLVSKFAEKKKLGRASYGLLVFVVIPVCCLVLLMNLILFVVLRFANDNASGKSIAAKDLKVFGSSETFVRREGHLTHWGHFLISIDQYTLEAYNADREKLLESENGHYIVSDDEDFCPITYTWQFEVYETKISAIYDRLMKEDQKGKYWRMLSIRFPYQNSVRVPELEVDGIHVFANEETDASDGTVTYFYLIYDEDSIVNARCDEALNAEEMQVLRRAFLK